MIERFEELQEKVLEWADSHELLHEKNANKQFLKFIEEVLEFKTEMDIWNLYRKFKHDENVKQDFSIEEFERWKNLKLEMGDIFVTLIILCKQNGIKPMECLELAYEKIKNRYGKTINGMFIKAEDLHD
ncbi:MAG: MazG-like family protein [Ezakiella coagulans]|uniref:MazG-like family protein n=1 Tax=Ezakiella coagulans TaxID=46507 RepID=UPI003999D8EF